MKKKNGNGRLTTAIPVWPFSYKTKSNLTRFSVKIGQQLMCISLLQGPWQHNIYIIGQVHNAYELQ